MRHKNIFFTIATTCATLALFAGSTLSASAQVGNFGYGSSTAAGSGGAPTGPTNCRRDLWFELLQRIGRGLNRPHGPRDFWKRVEHEWRIGWHADRTYQSDIATIRRHGCAGDRHRRARDWQHCRYRWHARDEQHARARGYHTSNTRQHAWARHARSRHHVGDGQHARARR